MMVDAFDPDMLCFQTQLNDEDEFEAMQMRPYSGNPLWLERKLPSLTSSVGILQVTKNWSLNMKQEY